MQRLGRVEPAGRFGSGANGLRASRHARHEPGAIEPGCGRDAMGACVAEMAVDATGQRLEVEVFDTPGQTFAARRANLGQPEPHAIAGEQQVVALGGDLRNQRQAHVDLANRAEPAGDALERPAELPSLARMVVEQPQGFAQTTGRHPDGMRGVRVAVQRPVPSLCEDTEGNFRSGDGLRHGIFVVGCQS